MGLLKAKQAEQANVLRFSLRDIEAEAQARLDRAAQEVDAILADARSRAADIESDARASGAADGHAEGLARGHEEGRQQALADRAVELAELFASLSSAASELNAMRQRFESDAMHDVVELAIAIATKVAKRQAQIDPQVMVENLRAALALTGRGSEIRVAVHPSQRAVLEAALPSMKLEWPSLNEGGIVGDETVAPGGCRVFTTHGRIDADLDAQLDRVVHDLLPDSNHGNSPAR
jgi:flagellar assembly protein FliH